MNATKPHRPGRYRRHIKPSFTLKPITTMRWCKHSPLYNLYGQKVSGTRYFLFGLIPILTIWDRPEGTR